MQQKLCHFVNNAGNNAPPAFNAANFQQSPQQQRNGNAAIRTIGTATTITAGDTAANMVPTTIHLEKTAVTTSILVEQWTWWGNFGNNNNRNNNQNLIKRFINWNYCWNHGCDVEGFHKSQSCPAPEQRHQQNATRKNPMGGSSKGTHKNALLSSVGKQEAKPNTYMQQQPQWKGQQNFG